MRYSTSDLITLRGTDAAAFAQAQLASDAASLADGHWHWTSYLTPQGRTIAVMVLVRHAADALDLLVPAARGAELAARLQRFVFRSKVRLAADPGRALHVRVRAGSAPDAKLDGTADAYRVRLADSLVLEPAAEPADTHEDETAFRDFLVDAGIPLLAGAAVEAQTPHALGLDALGAISTNKGCYPGQEIVARTHFLGRNKRHLCRFEATGGASLPAPGDIVESDAGAAAEVVLALNRAEGSVGGLAVAHEQALTGSAAFRLGGSAATLVRVR